MKEKKEKNQLLERLRNKYRLVILNDETFEEKLSLRLSRLNVFVVVGVVGVLLVALTTIIIAFTPLREYIPGYSSTALKRQAMENALRVDSLERTLRNYEQYMMIVQGIVEGNPVSFETADTQGVAPPEEQDFTVSSADSALRDEVAQEDRYNISRKPVSSGRNILENYTFFPPLKGVVTDDFNPSNEHYGVDIVSGEDEPILCTLDGTVIFSSWTSSSGHVIAVQHAGDLFSIYKHNSVLLKSQGDRVQAGEAIAIVGNSGEETTGPHLHFELWFNGSPMDPTKYMNL
jgi:murein DD-endopeptidase MepM/ murein hydrolase activator NlpD